MTLTSPRPTVVPDEPVDALGTLLARVGRGDHDAFAALYDATAATVYGLALNVVGDEDLACEVVRRTFAEVWRDAPAYSRSHGPAAAWVVATAHRISVAHVRRHGTSVPVGPSPTPLLADLDPDDRRAVRLAWFGGRTYAEVAISTGTSDHVAAGRLGAALRAIRDASRGDVA